MEYSRDPAKHERNLREPGFGFDTAALIFAGETIEAEDDRRPYGEIRMRAIGEAEGVILSVVYTDRGPIRWIISAWKAGRKERKRWHEP